MHSPPPAKGSSRAVGGILRGNASGNVFNLADASDQVASLDLGARRGSTLVSPTYSSWIPVDSSGFHCIPLEYTYV